MMQNSTYRFEYNPFPNSPIYCQNPHRYARLVYQDITNAARTKKECNDLYHELQTRQHQPLWKQLLRKSAN